MRVQQTSAPGKGEKIDEEIAVTEKISRGAEKGEERKKTERKAQYALSPIPDPIRDQLTKTLCRQSEKNFRQ